MKADPTYHCPVCRASFRETSTCSRCGADLTRLMTLVAQSHALRQRARRALAGGDPETGLNLARQAQAACATPRGRQLYLLALWMHQTAGSDEENLSPLFGL